MRAWITDGEVSRSTLRFYLLSVPLVRRSHSLQVPPPPPSAGGTCLTVLRSQHLLRILSILIAWSRSWSELEMAEHPLLCEVTRQLLKISSKTHTQRRRHVWCLSSQGEGKSRQGEDGPRRAFWKRLPLPGFPHAWREGLILKEKSRKTVSYCRD